MCFLLDEYDYRTNDVPCQVLISERLKPYQNLMNKERLLLSVTTASIATSIFATQDEKQWTLRLETGTAATLRNDTQIPGDSGTRFSLKDITGSGPFNFQRWELLYRQSEDTEWRLLYAPFRISGTGNLNAPTNFRGTTFNAGAASANYQFNSYRLTYRRKWKKTAKSDWMFGYTLKIRDAEISLRQGITSETERDPRGIVPLLNISGKEQLNRQWFATFDFDGLAGGPGRAFDIGAQLHYQASEDTSLYFGIRTLEGGADVPRVYSFAWVNYLSVGISKRF
jgi:hypothetical protein